MNVDLKMCAAKIVREVMKAHSRSPDRIFNNVYKNGTRTVKCYAAGKLRDRLAADIEKVLEQFCVPFRIKYTEGCRHWGAPGLIIKFPVQK